MFRRHLINNNEIAQAQAIYANDVLPWERMDKQEQEIQLSVKWISRVNQQSIQASEKSVSFRIQVAPVRADRNGEFVDRYCATIQATEVGIFRIKIDHLDEVTNLKMSAEGSKHQKRVSLCQLAEGPLKFRDLFAQKEEHSKFSVKINEKSHSFDVEYQTSTPLLRSTIEGSDDSLGGSPKEIHKLTVNFKPFQIIHSINNRRSQIKYNANDLLSIEPKGSEVLKPQDPIPKNLLDSRSFASNLNTANELFNEDPFKGLLEDIPVGPQALSFDVQIGNGESDQYKIYGLGERCEGKLSLENTI